MGKNKNFYTVSEDYYKILDISSGASLSEIKKAFLERTSINPEILDSYNELKRQLIEIDKDLEESSEEIKEALEEEKAEFLKQFSTIEKDMVKNEKVVEAYIVLTTYREEYDKARTKFIKKEKKRADEKVRGIARKIYVARKKANKAVQKATRLGVKTDVDYDALLGVDSTASLNEIHNANKSALLIARDDELDSISEAFKVLSNSKKNKAYHEAKERSINFEQYRNSEEYASLVQRIEEGYRPHLLSRKAKIILGSTSAAVLATAIIAGAVGISKHSNKDNNKNIPIENTYDFKVGKYKASIETDLSEELTEITTSKNTEVFGSANDVTMGIVEEIGEGDVPSDEMAFTPNNQKYSIDVKNEPTNSINSSTDVPAEDLGESDVPSVETTFTPNNQKPGLENKPNEVIDYTTGTVNDAIVTAKVEQLASSMKEAGLVNIETGLPYETEELKNIILYMNGLYVPENEQDVYYMYTSYINLSCSLLNNEVLLYQVNYHGGETSFKAKIEEASKDPKYINFVDAVLIHNSYGMEYAKWLQDQYFTLLYTTDKETYNKIYSEVWQSYADLMKGNGATFTLDGISYTVTSEKLLEKDNVDIASLVTFWLYNFEPFRNRKTQEKFKVVQKFLSADEEEQVDQVAIQELFDSINTYCDLYSSDEYSTINGQTWGQRLQSNMKAIGYEQLAEQRMQLTR